METAIRVRTTASTHVVYRKTVMGASVHSLGGCGCSLGRSDNYFILLRKHDQERASFFFKGSGSYSAQSMYSKPLSSLWSGTAPVWMLKPSTKLILSERSPVPEPYSDYMMPSPGTPAPAAAAPGLPTSLTPMTPLGSAADSRTPFVGDVGTRDGTHDDGTYHLGGESPESHMTSHVPLASSHGPGPGGAHLDVMSGSVGSRAPVPVFITRTSVRFTLVVDEVCISLGERGSNSMAEFHIQSVSVEVTTVYQPQTTPSGDNSQLTRLSARVGLGFDACLLQQTSFGSRAQEEQIVIDPYRLRSTLLKVSAGSPVLLEMLALQKLSIYVSPTLLYTVYDALALAPSNSATEDGDGKGVVAAAGGVNSSFVGSGDDVQEQDADEDPGPHTPSPLGGTDSYVEFFVENKLGQTMFVQFHVPFELQGDAFWCYDDEDYREPNTIYLLGDNSVHRVPPRSTIGFRLSVGLEDVRDPLALTVMKVFTDGWHTVGGIPFSGVDGSSSLHPLQPMREATDDPLLHLEHAASMGLIDAGLLEEPGGVIRGQVYVVGAAAVAAASAHKDGKSGQGGRAGGGKRGGAAQGKGKDQDRELSPFALVVDTLVLRGKEKKDFEGGFCAQRPMLDATNAAQETMHGDPFDVSMDSGVAERREGGLVGAQTIDLADQVQISPNCDP